MPQLDFHGLNGQIALRFLRMGDETKRGYAGTVQKKASQEHYERILNDFTAANRSGPEAVAHLVSLGFSSGQAKSAVYRFRQRHGLIGRSTSAEG